MIQGTLLLSSVCSLSSSQKTGGFGKYGNNSSAQIPAEWISQLGLLASVCVTMNLLLPC